MITSGADLVQGRTLPEAYYHRYKIQPERNSFFTKTDGQWVPSTYRESFRYLRSVMSGLRKAGFKRGEKIVIFAENRKEWVLTDLAAQWLGGATTGIYLTNTPEQVEYILNECEAVIAFVSNTAMLKKFESLTNLKFL